MTPVQFFDAIDHYLKEEIDGFYEGMHHKYKLFPFSQYKFKDPCKKCLVRPACTMACIDSLKHDKFKAYIYQRVRAIKRTPQTIKNYISYLIYRSEIIDWAVGCLYAVSILVFVCCWAAVIIGVSKLFYEVWLK